MDPKIAEQQIRTLLVSSFWLPTIRPDKTYCRTHDDHDGRFNGVLTVTFDFNGDAYLWVDQHPSIRFRTVGGGGMSYRTRMALLILAEAIRLDNEFRPNTREIQLELFLRDSDVSSGELFPSGS